MHNFTFGHESLLDSIERDLKGCKRLARNDRLGPYCVKQLLSFDNELRQIMVFIPIIQRTKRQNFSQIHSSISFQLTILN